MRHLWHFIFSTISLPLPLFCQFSGKSRSSQENTAIHRSIFLTMCLLPMSAIFYTSLADIRPGRIWRLLSDPFWSVPSALALTSTSLFMMIHILLISDSKSLYLLRFYSLTEPDIHIVQNGTVCQQACPHFLWSTASGRLASIIQSVRMGTSHMNAVLLMMSWTGS